MRFAHCEMQNSNKSAFILYLNSSLSVRAGLKPIETTAPNWVPRTKVLSLAHLKQLLPIWPHAYYGCSSTHNNTLQISQRTTIGNSPPKDSSTCEKICMTASFTRITHHFTCTTHLLPVPRIISPVPRIISPVQIHKSDRSCMCVLWVLILTLSLRFCF